MPSFQAYERYKTTEIPWFPRIPKHWHMDRAKWSVASPINGTWGGEPNGDEDIICLRVADFDRTSLKINTNKLTTRSVPLSDRVKRLLCNGDLLIEKSGGGEQQLVGTVVQFDKQFDAVTSNFIARIVPVTGVVSRFLLYVHSHLYSGRVTLRSIKQTTGIQNLDTQSYFDEVIAYPPTEEQDAIARFLDFKTAQIDALIAKKRVLLDKLAEKRTSMISRAVTKGLNASVPTKDSGFSWLRQIPSHWDAKRLRFSTTMSGGMTPSTSNPEFWDGDIPWITPKDMKRELLSGSEDTLTEEALKQTAITLYDAGKVLIVVRGMILAHTFPVAINTVNSTVNQDMKAISTVMNGEYLALLLRGIQPLILSLVEEAAHGTKVLRTDVFRNLVL